jgi:hypothetical protein
MSEEDGSAGHREFRAPQFFIGEDLCQRHDQTLVESGTIEQFKNESSTTESKAGAYWPNCSNIPP